MKYITENGKNLPDDEICMTFYGINIMADKRTHRLYETLKSLKKKQPDATVVGFMGSDHFTKAGREKLALAAHRDDVRIVVHNNTESFDKEHTGSWSIDHCGSYKEGREKIEKTLDRVMKEEGLQE